MGGMFERTELSLGESGVEKLKNAHVLVVGIGGVGGFACEALARAGVGALTLCDFDTVAVSNINRQIIAMHSTVGQKKAELMAERVRDINPDCAVRVMDLFYSAENSNVVFDTEYTYIIDAIDIVTSKLHLIKTAHEQGMPIISALGTGNKSDPSQFKIADISKTSVCPLARVVRYELRQMGIGHTKVLYSTEIPIKVDCTGGKMVASNSFTPSVAGLLIAREAILEIAFK